MLKAHIQITSDVKVWGAGRGVLNVMSAIFVISS